MKPADHALRMDRVRQTLTGTRVGDAFGQSFFLPEDERLALIGARILAPAPWHYTDDTAMSLVVAGVLDELGGIDQDLLAERFAAEYAGDPMRAYGGSVQALLRGIREGGDWWELSRAQFEGMGSYGNGAAMRSAVVGAYFAGERERIVRQAELQAEVTHAHEEGKAGAVAVALAAGMAVDLRHIGLAEIAAAVPLLNRAAGLSLETAPAHAARILGNGTELRAADTVPLALWTALRFWGDLEGAMWSLVAAGGDRDTTCAIAGGVMAAGGAEIPAEWLARAEDASGPGTDYT